jgi:hypothetical protein
MDLKTAFAQLHWPAVGVSTVLAFVIGGLWYSPILFARAWMQENRLTSSDLEGRNKGAVFGGSFMLLLFAAVILGMFLGAKSNAGAGIAAGLLVGVGWLATSLGVLYLFEARNAGYLVVTFAVMGAVLGAWH